MVLLLFGLFSDGAPGAIPLEDFRWRTPIEGSLESGKLYRLAIPAAVFDGSRAFPADMRLVDETESDWPFFLHHPDPPAPEVAFPLKRLEAPAGTESLSGVQALYFDTAFRRNPLHRLVLQAAEPQFSRVVKVYGRDSATNQWRWMADGTIHRGDGQDRDSVELHNVGFRFLKVDILHADEPELAITNAIALSEPTLLVTRPTRTGTAWLYYGSDMFVLPRFELRHATTRAQLAEAGAADFGARGQNPLHIRHEILRYGRLLLFATLCVVGVLAAAMIVKRLRSS